jgi:hypothetical protein
VGVGGFLLAWTWGALPDLLIDYGREVYVPWRLSLGDRLYHDIAYFNGPLSPYLNSWIFRAFSPGILSLSLVNAGILACMTALLFRLLRRASDEWTATWSCLLFLSVFAFQLFQPGPFNYIAPYSHEMTHGLLLCLLGLTCVEFYREVGGFRWVLGAGAAVGLTLLTKPEVALASMAVLLGIWLSARERGGSGGRALLHISVCALGALGVLGLAYLLLTRALSAPDALSGLMAPWAMMTDADVTALPFYRTSLGLDDIGGNLATMAAWGGAYSLLFGAAAVLAWTITEPRRPISIAGLKVGFFLVSFVLSLSLWALGGLERAARPLPILILTLLVLEASGSGLVGENPGRGRRRTLRIVLLAFSFLLLLKMLFAGRVIGYGFVLAMPAAMMAALALLDWIPSKLQEKKRWGGLFRTWALGFVVAFVSAHLLVARERLQVKSHRVAVGPDVVRIDPGKGAVLDRAMEVARQSLGPNGTLAVIPEGAMLNFFLRARNPTPFFNLMPPEVVHFGEGLVTTAFSEAPPDVVILVHKDLGYYGVGAFGTGYGQMLAGWVKDKYRLVGRVGDPPFADGSAFGIDIMVLKDRP